jgi:hypothetical protein
MGFLKGIVTGAVVTGMTGFLFISSVRNDHLAALDALKSGSLAEPKKRAFKPESIPFLSNSWATSDHYNSFIRKLAEKLGRF